jgi:N-acetylneuraminate synthase
MTLVIAEAGVNHNGDPKIALELIDAAKKAGADVVKFQTFKTENLVIDSAKKARYQASASVQDESQANMLKKLELPYLVHHDLLRHCEQIGIQFLSTAFDSESLEFLVDDLGLKRLKIPSGEITNAPFLLKHARTGCSLIVSTGMASLAEIEFALGVIAFGYLSDYTTMPSVEEFQFAYSSDRGQAALKKNVTLLHCTSEYPAPLSSVNLNVIETLGQAFALPVGYSDHTVGIAISIASVAKGATVVEKHFTLDKQMEGPDHKSSLDPDELSAMVSGIRSVELALGSTIKAPSASEIENKVAIRKSLVANRDIALGDLLTSENLAIKRPGSGIAPQEYWRFIGSVSQRQYRAGDLIIE